MNPRTNITINGDGSVEVVTIDYDAETGPFWYVVVDGTPVCPDRPLPLEHAIAAFRREVAEAAEDGSTVELQQCDEESLVWAGVRSDDGEDDAAESEASC